MCGRLVVKIHTFGTRWRRVVCFMFWALNPRKRAPCIHQRGSWVSPSTSLDTLMKRSPYPNDVKSVLVLQLKTSLFTQLLYSSSQNWCFIIPKYSIVTIFCAYYLFCSISMHLFRCGCSPLVSFNFTVYLYGTLEPLDGFPRNLMFENLWKIVKLFKFLFRSDVYNNHFIWRSVCISMHILTKFSLEWKTFHARVVEKNGTF